MSDFDKEAEREKLRKKYERDAAKREATQRMSDLLLKGATMTNAHCGTCGDPLFEQDGTTFCPSCHGNPDAVEGTDLEAQPAEDEPADQQGQPDRAMPDVDQSTAEADRSSPVSDRSTPETARSHPRDTDTADTAEPARPDRQEPKPGERASADDVPSQKRSTTDRSAGKSQSAGRSGNASNAPDRSGGESTVGGQSAGGRSVDLETAHGSLVAALEKFARKAAETDDPRHARECLEAAREASETIDVLR